VKLRHFATQKDDAFSVRGHSLLLHRTSSMNFKATIIAHSNWFSIWI